ncbi:hypothetical protein JXA84_07945 [candidate division WOR-3 bacterium]|nr:hypothetical protein [candidate division WOR-3 bacterium]
MKRIFFVVLAFLLISQIHAETIEEIREAYNKANEMINNQELYVTEMKINSSGIPFPGSGIYEKKVFLYWECNPELDDFYHLVKVHCRKTISAFEEYSEMLFNDKGQLIFFYRKGGYGENQDEETRFYFSGWELIRVIQNGEVFNSPDRSQTETAQAIIEEAKDLYKAFKIIHSD